MHTYEVKCDKIQKKFQLRLPNMILSFQFIVLKKNKI